MKDKEKKTPETEAEVNETVEETVEETAEETAENPLAAELDAAKAELAAEKEKFLRMAAEYDNFRRRSAKEREAAYSDAYADALMQIIPVIDNLERAIEAAEKTDDEGAKALADGVKMTLNSLFEGMKRFGFEEVPALGEDFDPELHNAVMRETTDDPGKVLEVFQKGYRVKDKIIRYAMVKTAN